VLIENQNLSGDCNGTIYHEVSAATPVPCPVPTGTFCSGPQTIGSPDSVVKDILQADNEVNL